jgi:hypothetical protein
MPWVVGRVRLPFPCVCKQKVVDSGHGSGKQTPEDEGAGGGGWMNKCRLWQSFPSPPVSSPAAVCIPWMDAALLQPHGRRRRVWVSKPTGSAFSVRSTTTASRAHTQAAAAEQREVLLSSWNCLHPAEDVYTMCVVRCVRVGVASWKGRRKCALYLC